MIFGLDFLQPSQRKGERMFYIIVSCISIYFFAVLAVKYSKSVSLDEAQKIIDDFLKNYIKEFVQYLFPNSQASQNWLADGTLIRNLLMGQENFNLLPPDLTKYRIFYHNGVIPCVSIQFIPKNGISVDTLKTILCNIVTERLIYFNVTNPFVYIHVQSTSDTEQTLSVLYAVTDLQKTEMQKLLSGLNQRACQSASQIATLPVDKKLIADIAKENISYAPDNTVQVGFDMQTRVPINIDINRTGMIAVVGGTGSGKSVAVLYLLYNVKKMGNSEIFLVDFKRSGDFAGISQNYAEAEESTTLIEEFYDIFQDVQEGSEKIHLLLIDEYAGYITWLMQNDKKKAEEIKGKISTILMMGRSRRCFVWCVQQRISASLFPSGIGAIDNFQVCIGLGRLSPDSRKSLFAGEHLQDEDFEAGYNPGTGQGLILVDGQPLQALQIPFVNKKSLHDLLSS